MAFYRKYPNPGEFAQQAVSQLRGAEKAPPAVAKLSALFVQEPLAQILWYHHIALLEKLDNPTERLRDVHQVIEQGWSHNIPALQILPHLAAKLPANKKLPRGGDSPAGHHDR